ncbi:hypothetical protein ACFOEZ_11955 [Tianweitania populi]|uniref:Uncharacterized protein n=1 Tax=Tianweitania populi TaxID=1607949 RepID=A0A8J3DRZ9_9HYPH|nr:hypothetical protein [Tianweitania populi]GHD23557.1 hypothetical protein GCM10016234_38850 [Tianweitania populi]
MTFLETTALRCRPPDNLAELYAKYSEFPVYRIDDDTGGFLVEYEDNSFAIVKPTPQSLEIEIRSAEYILCGAIGAQVLATLHRIVPEIPSEVPFKIEGRRPHVAWDEITRTRTPLNFCPNAS